MKIRANGELMEIEDGTTVAGLIEKAGIKPQGMAVELNREIVPRGEYTLRVLKEGDSLEIVRMVGGG